MNFTPCFIFFSIFSQNFFIWILGFLRLKFIEGNKKKIKNTAGCFKIWLNAPKMVCGNEMFAVTLQDWLTAGWKTGTSCPGNMTGTCGARTPWLGSICAGTPVWGTACPAERVGMGWPAGTAGDPAALAGTAPGATAAPGAKTRPGNILGPKAPGSRCGCPSTNCPGWGCANSAGYSPGG